MTALEGGCCSGYWYKSCQCTIYTLFNIKAPMQTHMRGFKEAQCIAFGNDVTDNSLSKVDENAKDNPKLSNALNQLIFFMKQIKK